MIDAYLSPHLPFNRERLGESFVPAKGGGAPPAPAGRWLIVQEQGVMVCDAGPLAPDRGTPVVPAGAADFRLPEGTPPPGFAGQIGPPFWLGTWHGAPVWVAELPKGVPVPPGFRRETLVPMQGARLPDDLLSLGGMAMQLLWWESTSGHCPRCGDRAARIEGEWGKRCPGCQYEHYPHLHPAVIILIRDGDRVLLARKSIWAPGRYALIAGFVDNGESLEGCVHREVQEEVGVQVKNLQYVGSQNWPFPSQLMIGYVVDYAGGEIRVDQSELEDARWFPRTELPMRPTRHSIAGQIIETYARM